MGRRVSIEDALGKVEKLYKLTESKLVENDNRWIAFNELSRKIRASLNALHYIPYEEYEVLCAPANLLYRSIITDLMTLLLISQVNDEQLQDVIDIFDYDFAKSLNYSLKVNIEIRKATYPHDADAFEEQRREYQDQLYDDLKELLSSAKGEEWILKPKKKVSIKGYDFNGNVSQMYDILKSYDDVSGFAYLYQYYRLLSQSEHFSIKGRTFNYKQSFHEEYYNKVRGFLYLGADYLISKYSKS